MKAQRRHELKTNTLAQQLERLPFTLREHGGKVLFGVVAILLIIVVLNYRSHATRESLQTANEHLSTARQLIDELQNVTTWRMPPAEIASQVRDSLDGIAQASDDPQVQAETLVARGDLNWTLANLPDLPGASTQPTLRIEQSKPDLLAAAADAYQRVLQDYPDQTLSVVSAHFGLAAIAEDRGEWDRAAEQYNAIRSDPQASESFKNLAKLRQEGLRIPGQGKLPGLADIRNPILLGQPTTAPATLPAAAVSPTTNQAIDELAPEQELAPATPSDPAPSAAPTTQPGTP